MVNHQNLHQWQKDFNNPNLSCLIFITNFLKEAKLFNKSFSESCQNLRNNSTLLKPNLYYRKQVK